MDSLLLDEDRTSMEVGYTDTLALCLCCVVNFIVARDVYCSACLEHFGRFYCGPWTCDGTCTRCDVRESQELGYPYPWEEAA